MALGLAVVAACGVALGKGPKGTTKWNADQWTHDGENIKINLDAFKFMGKKPNGDTSLHWHATTNEPKGKSWASARIGDHPAIIIAKDKMSGQQIPSPDQQVAVFAATHPISLGGEGESRTITLSPLKPRGGAAIAEAGQMGDLEKRLQSLEDGEREELLSDEEEERSAMLQVGEMFVDPFLLNWGAWNWFVGAGVATAWWTATAAAAAAKDAKTDMERAEVVFPSLEMKVANRAKPIRFRTPSDLEMFLPAALPLVFYPWGLAIGTTYFATATATAAAFVEGTTKAVDTAVKAGWPFFPWYPFSKDASKSWSGRAESWYWNALFMWHVMTYWYLVWQTSGYFWMYWNQHAHNPTFTGMTDYWKEHYKTYTDKLKEYNIPYNPLFPWIPLPSSKHTLNLAASEKAAAPAAPAVIVAAAPEHAEKAAPKK